MDRFESLQHNIDMLEDRLPRPHPMKSSFNVTTENRRQKKILTL